MTKLEGALKFKKIIKDYTTYEAKTPMRDAINAARCSAALAALECEMLTVTK